MDRDEAYLRLARQVNTERREVAHQLNAAVDQLTKIRHRSLKIDRIGSGLQVGSGVMMVGGLVASTTTDRAALSLALTTAGTATGVVGALLSGGANIGGFLTTQNPLERLIIRLEQHHRNLSQLHQLDPMASVTADMAIQFRKSLDQLITLSQNGFIKMLLRMESNSLVHPGVADGFRGKLPTVLDPKVLQSLAKCLVRSIKYGKMSRKAAWALLAYRIAGSEVAAMLPDTPLSMDSSERRKALIISVIILILDFVHWKRLRRTQEDTPVVNLLRSMSYQCVPGKRD